MLIQYFKTLLSHIFLITIIFIGQTSFGQSIKPSYYSFLDSSQAYIDVNPKVAEQFLSKIPQPITKSISGRLGHYYQLKGLINNTNEEPIKEFQNFSEALKYAKLEKDYDIAGMASLELFYNTYIIKKDTAAFDYLKDAKQFYKKTNMIIFNFLHAVII